jgi:hypothetical protein
MYRLAENEVSVLILAAEVEIGDEAHVAACQAWR